MKRLIGVCLLTWVLACEDAPEIDPVVAEVDGLPIRHSELERSVWLTYGDDRGAASTPSVRRAVLDELINRRLLLARIDRGHVLVTTAEVRAQAERLRAGWTGTEFEAALKRLGLTSLDVTNEARTRLRIDKYLQQEVVSRVSISDADIETELHSMEQAAAGNPPVRLHHMLLDSEEGARKILRSLARGTSFSEAAGKYSLSADARDGGDLGPTREGELPDAVWAACSAGKPGETVGPVASRLGYHICKIPRDQKVSDPGAWARSRARRALWDRRAREVTQRFFEDLRRSASIEIREAEVARF